MVVDQVEALKVVHTAHSAVKVVVEHDEILVFLVYMIVDIVQEVGMVVVNN